MTQLSYRERVFRTFSFQTVDKVAFDLMENTVWPEISAYFSKAHGLNNVDEILDFLDCDFRWIFALSPFSQPVAGRDHFSDNQSQGLLADIDDVNQLDRLFNPNPDHRIIPDFRQFSDRYPHHARIFAPLWMPAFYNCCMDFGMENALCYLMTQPELIQAYVEKHSECTLSVLKHALEQGAAKYCDFYWIGDDFASETTLLMHPDIWRQIFKPSISKQVKLAREAGLMVLFHSCGAVSDVYEDFIEMGIQAHCGVQTSAYNMSIEQLASGYGGRFVVYGGVDAQTTLIQEQPAGVMDAVQRNMLAFEPYGGYVVSNAHHTLSDLPGENLVAMAKGAGRI